jgi:hypothetical protein
MTNNLLISLIIDNDRPLPLFAPLQRSGYKVALLEGRLPGVCQNEFQKGEGGKAGSFPKRERGKPKMAGNAEMWKAEAGRDISLWRLPKEIHVRMWSVD